MSGGGASDGLRGRSRQTHEHRRRLSRRERCASARDPVEQRSPYCDIRGATMRPRALWTVIFFSLVVLGSLNLRAQPVALPAFNINPNETSVSGLSSGGYMAVQ